MEYQPPPRPQAVAPRRAVTLPTTLQSSQRNSSHAPQNAVETLYSHPNAKIISFTTGKPSLVPEAPEENSEPGTLPWSSRLERTIAFGSFRIYRAPGSVAFLSCGSALQPILPKSQCWCIDEANSKFILQIRRPNYWRIELPISTQEDRELALSLRQVFDNILHFEKTVCPFQRPFTIELPEKPPTPIKKKPWAAPAHRSLVIDYGREPVNTALGTSELRTKQWAESNGLGILNATPNQDTLDHVDSPNDAAKDVDDGPAHDLHQCTTGQFACLDSPCKVGKDFDTELRFEVEGGGRSKADHEPFLSVPVTEAIQIHSKRSDTVLESCPPGIPSSAKQTPSTQAGSMLQGSKPCSKGIAEATTDQSSEIHEGAGNRTGLMKTKLRRSRTQRLPSTRSMIIPPQLSLRTSPPSKSDTAASSAGASSSPITDSLSGSQDSFHSVLSWHSPLLPPSPPPSKPAKSSGPPRFPLGATYLQRLDSQESGPVDAISDQASDRASIGSGVEATPIAYMDPMIADSKVGGDTTPPNIGDSSGMETIRPKLRHRAITSGALYARPRAASPVSPTRAPPSQLPASSSLASLRQVSRGRLGMVGRIPMAVITKTCELLLGPPSHLIALMLRVAAKIVAGEWRGRDYGVDANGNEIPVQWDYLDEDWSDLSDDERLLSSARHLRNRKGSCTQGQAASTAARVNESQSWDVD